MMFFAQEVEQKDDELMLIIKGIERRARFTGRADIILALDEMADIRNGRSLSSAAEMMASLANRLQAN